MKTTENESHMIKGWSETALIPWECNLHTLLAGAIESEIAGSSLLLTLLLLRLRREIYNIGECNKHTLLYEHFFDWLQIIQRSEYLQIIDYLRINKYVHVRGLLKIFGGDPGNIAKKISTLQGYGIIQPLNLKNSERDRLNSIRNVFNIPITHFRKTQWYELTPTGELFFKDLPFEEFLPEEHHKVVQEWKQKIQQRFKETRQTILSEIEAISEIKKRHAYQQSVDISWVDRQVKLFEEKGVTFSISAEQILGEIQPNTRYKPDTKVGYV